MTNSRVSACIVGTIVALFGSVAAAQELTPAVAADTSLGESSKARLGVVLSPMPAGTFKWSAGPLSGDDDAKFAFAIMPTFDFSLNQFLFIGVAPQYIFNVKPDDSDGDAASELDLRARIGGIAKVADTIRVFGYAAPGYSIMMLPDEVGRHRQPRGLRARLRRGRRFRPGDLDLPVGRGRLPAGLPVDRDSEQRRRLQDQLPAPRGWPRLPAVIERALTLTG